MLYRLWIILIIISLFSADIHGQEISADGIATYYYSPGMKKSEGKLVNGRAEGQWIIYNKRTGAPDIICQMRKGERNGPGVILWENGDTAASGIYRHNKMHGEWKFYLTGRRLKYSETYKDGIKNGKMLFYDTVTRKMNGSCEFKNGLRHGELITYSAHTGKPMGIETFQNDILNGRLVVFDSITGHKYGEGTYKDGKIIGEWRTWYRHTGGIRTITLHQGDNIIWRKEYSVNGNLVQESYWQTDGGFTEYDSVTRKVIYKSVFLNGRFNSRIKSYHRNTGAVLKAGEFREGQPDGKWLYYDSTGKLIGSKTFNKGVLNGELTFYHPYNSIKSVYLLVAGVKNGAFTYFYNDAIWIEGSYRDDLRDGLMIVYYPSGAVRRKIFFEKGMAITDSCFAENGDIAPLYKLFEEEHFKGNVMTYIGNNLRYPQSEIDSKTEGAVHVSFVVEANGQLSNVTVSKSMGDAFDEEAVRLISQMPPWEPYRVDGKAMSAYKTLPVYFWLNETIN